MPITPELEAAYRETEYRVASSTHDFVMLIGQPCPQVQALLWDYAAESAVFITAYNPFSQRRSDAENEAAQARLRQRLAALDAVAVLDGEGLDPSSQWPGEPSYLALGISLEQGRQLAKAFQQHAFVHVAKGQAPNLIVSGRE